jgi:hypothetical protein
MINRVIFAYLGAIGLPALFLPLAIFETMGGHSLMYVSVLTSPIGLITALAYSDKKRKFSQNAKATRTFLGFVVFVLWFIVVLTASETIASTFLKTKVGCLLFYWHH